MQGTRKNNDSGQGLRGDAAALTVQKQRIFLAGPIENADLRDDYFLDRYAQMLRVLGMEVVDARFLPHRLQLGRGHSYDHRDRRELANCNILLYSCSVMESEEIKELTHFALQLDIHPVYVDECVAMLEILFGHDKLSFSA